MFVATFGSGAITGGGGRPTSGGSASAAGYWRKTPGGKTWVEGAAPAAIAGTIFTDPNWEGPKKADRSIGDKLFGDRWYEFWGDVAVFGLGFGVGALVGAGAVWTGHQVATAVGGLWGAVAQIGTTAAMGWAASQTAMWAFSPEGTPWHQASAMTISGRGEWFLTGGYIGGIIGAAVMTAQLYEGPFKAALRTARTTANIAGAPFNFPEAGYNFIRYTDEAIGIFNQGMGNLGRGLQGGGWVPLGGF